MCARSERLYWAIGASFWIRADVQAAIVAEMPSKPLEGISATMAAWTSSTVPKQHALPSKASRCGAHREGRLTAAKAMTRREQPDRRTLEFHASLSDP